MSAGTVLTAVSLLADLVQAGARITAAAAQVSATITKAQQEGRDTLTPEEWATIQTADDLARAELQAEIDRRKAAP